MNIGEAGSSSSDGRGDEIMSGQPVAKPLHRYLYYRLYTKDGALESNNPIYANDRSINRVLAKSVAPPHTGASLKRHLCRTEGFEELGNHVLYPSLSATSTLADAVRLSLRGNTAPGSSESEPMALVVETSAVEKRSAATTVDPNTLPERHEKPRYVFYRVYEKGGEVASKTSFNETESSLGRINTLFIPPPHTVSSLTAHLIKVEGISSPDVHLFDDECGETIMNDDDAIALSSDHYPGIMEDAPIAIVYESQKGSSTSKLQDSAPPQDSAFSKQIKLKAVRENWSSPDPAWHSQTAGEIYKTDGILRTEKYKNRSRVSEHECYMAVSSTGKKALVFSEDMELC